MPSDILRIRFCFLVGTTPETRDTSMTSSFMILVSSGGTVRSCDYRSCDSRKILQIFNVIFYFSGHRHIIEVQPFGVPPIPRRRCGYSVASSEVIFCGGTRWAGTSGWSFNDFVTVQQRE